VNELAGRTAIVTGSTSGIGLGIAQAFAATGMHVMLNGFGDKAEIVKIRADMEEAYGIKTAYSAADMSKPDEIVRMVEDTRRLLGKVDVLVNNAGIQHVEAIETFPCRQMGRHHRHRPLRSVPRHPRVVPETADRCTSSMSPPRTA
jgi:3-hydroxybutyrate dehydrogenase